MCYKSRCINDFSGIWKGTNLMALKSSKVLRSETGFFPQICSMVLLEEFDFYRILHISRNQNLISLWKCVHVANGKVSLITVNMLALLKCPSLSRFQEHNWISTKQDSVFSKGSHQIVLNTGAVILLSACTETVLKCRWCFLGYWSLLLHGQPHSF